MIDEEKQIEEFEKVIDEVFEAEYILGYEPYPYIVAHALYNAGYRKQTEGEWTRIEVRGKNYAQVYYQHNDCKVNQTQMFPSPYNSCPNCGAKMKGGDAE